MFEIRNKENKRLVINLLSGTIDLLAKSTAVVSDEDYKSSHLQNLLRNGKVILVSKNEDKQKPKWSSKKVVPPKKEPFETGDEKESVISGSGTDEDEVPGPDAPEPEPIDEGPSIIEPEENDNKNTKKKRILKSYKEINN